MIVAPILPQAKYRQKKVAEMYSMIINFWNKS